MRYLVAAVVAGALCVRIARSRHRRFMHPDGRSFAGELDVPGGPETGAALIDRPGRHPVTVRISKGIGTGPGRADVMGLAVRVHGPDGDRRRDLLFSTAGRGRWSRHLPVPRRGFHTGYGSIVPYRTGTGGKVYLSADPAPGGNPLGATLESVVAAAERDGARLQLSADGQPFGTLIFGRPLTAGADAALAFDPVRNTTADLHPTGLIHASRSAAYPLSQRWRGVATAAPNPRGVARTAAHR